MQWEVTGEPIRPGLTDKCVILDVDETLIHTMDAKYYNLEHLLTHPQIGKEAFVVDLFLSDGLLKIWGYKRPDLDEFLKFCFNYFTVVAVWSAGGFEYVHGIVDYIFRHHKRPHIIFTNEDCSHKKVMTKPVSEMIGKVPGLNKYMRLENTWIVDDRQTNFLPNPQNGILIPAFEPLPLITTLHDERLKELMTWFTKPEVVNAKNILTLEQRIFS